MFKEFLTVARAELAAISKKGAVAYAKETNSSATMLKEISRLETERAKIMERFLNVEKAENYVTDQLAGQYINSIIAEMEGSGTPNKTLVTTIRQALMSNREYNTPLFTTGLLLAARDPRTIKLTKLGRSEAISVVINMNLTAGSMSDWANAILRVRTILINKKYNESNEDHGRPFNVNTEEMASHFWQVMYYGPAREGKPAYRRKFNRKTKEYGKRDVTGMVIEQYWWTMRKRLELAGKPAPYWEIIDKGIFGMGGSGTAYPSPQPTYFVRDTIAKITEIFVKKRDERKNLLRQDLKMLRKLMGTLQDGITEVDTQIKILKEQINRPAPKVKTVVKSTQVSAEQEFFARVIAYDRPYSQDKVRAVLEALNTRKRGEIIITAEGRVEITAPGGKRFRISLKGILSDFGIVF